MALKIRRTKNTIYNIFTSTSFGKYYARFNHTWYFSIRRFHMAESRAMITRMTFRKNREKSTRHFHIWTVQTVFYKSIDRSSAQELFRGEDRPLQVWNTMTEKKFPLYNIFFSRTFLRGTSGWGDRPPPILGLNNNSRFYETLFCEKAFRFK
jgi:hypothetical protein